MMFGKLPARRDPRNLRFGALLHSEVLHPPESYDDEAAFRELEQLAPRAALGETPTPMFANDAKPCCVIASRGHLTLRFERRERNALLSISDKEIEWEWLNETGGAVEGLVLLDSLKAWRQWGWTAGKRQHKCRLFAAVDPCNLDHVKTAIALTHAGLGLIGGWELPYAVTSDPLVNAEWAIVVGADSASDPAGGHCMVPVAYNARGVWFTTWGRLQFATWEWWAAYCSELYAVLDAPDEYQIGDKSDGFSRVVELVDVDKGEELLEQLAA